jgi:hypothetical protein
MTKQVIEYAGVPIGIVVPEQGRLRFIAVKFHVYELNDRFFNAPSDVLRAVEAMVAGTLSEGSLAA